MSIVQGAGAATPAATSTASAATAAAMAPGVPEGWNPQVIETAVQRLAAFVGPVARLLVQKAALAAKGETELYQLLGVAIPKESERQRFLAGAGQTPTSAPAAPPPTVAQPAAVAAFALPADLVDKLSQVLTGYLGPMARHVLASEAREAKSRDELYQRLGARIPSDKERVELLKKLRAQ